ncbi:MAG: hypothetical protein RLZ97_2595 [Verrucomicrobiota bacterium]|jgi:uncharacterized protein (TIGR02687 family)
MSDKRIHDSLNHCLQRHRLVFWYDSPGEWRKVFEGFEQEGVEKLVVRENEFASKVRILGQGDDHRRFLLYLQTERPPDPDNWLLDLLLQGHEFRADRASLAVQEVGLPYEFRAIAEEHVEFFRDAKRVQALKDLVSGDDEAADLRLKMMAVVARTPVEVEALLLDLLGRTSGQELMDPVVQEFGPYGLADHFWREVGRLFGYTADAPSLRDFVTRLFREANPLDPEVAPQAHSRVFLQRWKDSRTHNSSFRQWSAKLELDLHVAARLDASSDRIELGDADAFEIFDKFMIHRLCRGFESHQGAEKLLGPIQERRHSFWYPAHEHGYQAISQAVELRELLARAELSMDSVDAGLERYRASWWKIDRAYRRFSYHARQYGQVNVMEGLIEWVGKIYINSFLSPLGDRWSDQVRRMDDWTCGSLPKQRSFFEEHVRPFLNKGQKVFVIVSDALRYEAAADFAERMKSENRFSTKLNAMFGALPSYTQLGMASLLPGSAWEIDPVSAQVSLDGRSCTGTEARSEILKRALGGQGIAIQAEQFLEMKTQGEGRELTKMHEVIYIFHNVIDKLGDSPTTEARTSDAVEQAFEELVLIVKKVANVNGSNMLLTADHGFLFQQEPLDKGDTAALPEATEWTNRNRRFAIGREITESPATKVFDASQLGLPGDWSCAFPMSLGRFPLQGSGKRYVHGGFSLQEVVIPVVHINKSRSDDTGRVSVDIIRMPAKLTTGQLALSIYQEKPVTPKLLPRVLKIGVYTSDGQAISEMKVITFDSKDEEARKREVNVSLVLSKSADEHNNTTVEIRLDETLPGTSQTVTYRSYPIRLQKPFASDFDEF